MKVTGILVGWVFLLSSTSLAAPTAGSVDATASSADSVDANATAPHEARRSGEALAILDKRDGHMDVKTFGDKGCHKGHGQGKTQVGTGGKCVNSSNAKAVHVHGTSGLNPSGCSRIHAQYFLGLNCEGTKGVVEVYHHDSCNPISPNQNSAFMKCIGPARTASKASRHGK